MFLRKTGSIPPPLEKISAWWIAPSLIWIVLVLLFVVGLGQTPNETQDRAGRAMGFNDPFSAEHYWIILRNFSFASFLDFGYVYDWVLLGMQFAGLGLLLDLVRVGHRLKFWFFAVQPVIFPFSFLGVVLLPVLLWRFSGGMLDREDVIDIPFVYCVAHPAWVLVSILIAFQLHWLKQQKAG